MDEGGWVYHISARYDCGGYFRLQGCEDCPGYGRYVPMLELIGVIFGVIEVVGDAHSLGLKFNCQ